jgi:hypothetical protein
MSNCRADLGLGLSIVDISNRKEVQGFFVDVLAVDSDMYDNEEYYREDTLALGYGTEAERIVMERTKGISFNTAEKFEKVFNNVFEALSDQEFFGDCEVEILDLGDNKLAVAYAYGGYNKY